MHVHDVNMLIVSIYGESDSYRVQSDSYRVQSDSNMVKSDLHGWLETKCGIKLTCMKMALIGGKRMSNWMYMMLTC